MPSSIQPSNAFEAVCEIASQKDWCWNLYCGTCGHGQFRQAFYAITQGGHPAEQGWSNHLRAWSFGKNFKYILSTDEQSELAKVLSGSDVSRIRSNAKFPDWLGYLGLGLHYTEQVEWNSRLLTEAWVPQLLEVLEGGSAQHESLGDILENKGILDLDHLEVVESVLKYEQREQQPEARPVQRTGRHRRGRPGLQP